MVSIGPSPKSIEKTIVLHTVYTVTKFLYLYNKYFCGNHGMLEGAKCILIPIWKLGMLISSDVRYVCVCLCVCVSVCVSVHLCVCVCVCKQSHVAVAGPIDFKFYTITAEVNISLSLDFGEDPRSKTGSSGFN